LLIGAEQAGITLSYGCRQGICQLCRCNKASGVVKNIETGKISSDGYESIQTCINIAMTDVVLDI
jgi:ferredoxin